MKDMPTSKSAPEFRIRKFKTKICGLGSSDHVVHVTVTKSKDFYRWLGTVLWMSFRITFYPFEYPKGAKYPRDKVIAKETDHHRFYENKDGDRIDVFAGKKIVFLITHGQRKQMNLFKKVLEENTQFVKTKKSRQGISVL